MKNILVAEDEAYISEWFYQAITALGYHCIDCVPTANAVLDILKNGAAPDVLLLDLTLKNGGSGFDIAKYIDDHRLDIPYIITTAYKDYETLAKAKQYNPAGYLVKPFSQDNLYVAIEMALNNRSKTPRNVDKKDTEIFIKSGAKVEKLNLEDAMIVHTRGKYIEVTFGQTKKLIRSSLAAFIDTYNSVKWLRIHKSYAVNKNHIREVRRDFVVLNNIKVPIGRNYQDIVKAIYTDRELDTKNTVWG